MKFPEREIILKDGRKCVLRPTGPDLAAEMIEYMKVTAGETEWLLRYPDEVSFTLESEQEILGRILEDPGHVMMAAVVDGKVAGNCSIGGIGNKRKILHRCSLAIALYKEYWGLGIGTAMLNALTEVARERGVEQLELDFIEGNERACGLYEKVGFVRVAEHPDAVKLKDGSYRKLIFMVKKL